MRFYPRLDVDTWLLSFVAIALYLFVPDPLLAEETGFRIGAHVSLNNQWARYTTPANRNLAPPPFRPERHRGRLKPFQMTGFSICIVPVNLIAF